MNKKLRFYFVIGFLLIAAGLLIGSGQFIAHGQNSGSRSNFTVSVKPKFPLDKSRPLIKGQPSHISIPSVDISLEVEPGYYHKDSQTWTLSDTKAEFAAITMPANNQRGNTFIYGHNRAAVFGRLLETKPSDKAIVTTYNNHKFIYRLVKESTTKPSDLSLFSYQGPPILTLQTCSGVWDQNRTLLTFNLVEVV